METTYQTKTGRAYYGTWGNKPTTTAPNQEPFFIDPQIEEDYPISSADERLKLMNEKILISRVQQKLPIQLDTVLHVLFSSNKGNYRYHFEPDQTFFKVMFKLLKPHAAAICCRCSTEMHLTLEAISGNGYLTCYGKVWYAVVAFYNSQIAKK